MGAAGARIEGNKAVVAEVANQAIVCVRCLAIFVDHKAYASHRIAHQGQSDGALPMVWCTDDDGDIALFHLAHEKLVGQKLTHLEVLGDNDYAGGVFIQPMYQSGINRQVGEAIRQPRIAIQQPLNQVCSRDDQYPDAPPIHSVCR